MLSALKILFNSRKRRSMWTAGFECVKARLEQDLVPTRLIDLVELAAPGIAVPAVAFR